MSQALLNAIAHMTLSPDAQRVFHGRGGLHPGCEQWTLDLYPPVCLLTSYQPVSAEALAPIEAALHARWAAVRAAKADVQKELETLMAEIEQELKESAA